jgi:hypothetical protein
MIVVTENASGAPLRPRQSWLLDLPVKVSTIQFGKHSFQIVDLTAR